MKIVGEKKTIYLHIHSRHMIDSYDFGKIIVDGQKFTNDLIISKEGVEPNWWRKRGHELSKEDIEGVLAQKPDVLIVGTGFSGVLKVPKNVEDFIKAQGVEVIVKRTEEACNEYNRLCMQKNVIAALHLTC